MPTEKASRSTIDEPDASAYHRATVRAAVAVLVVGVAVAGAVYFNSLKLGSHRVVRSSSTGSSYIDPYGFGSDAGTYERVSAHASWQLPISILIGTLGVAGGLAILRRTPAG
jgi:hypothetical protein